MNSLPKSLVELEHEETIQRLERENYELRMMAAMLPDTPIVGLRADTPEKVNIETATFRKAVGAGFETLSDGVQYFGYVDAPERYELTCWTNTTQCWNKTGALYLLDHLNHNIQHELLKALQK